MNNLEKLLQDGSEKGTTEEVLFYVMGCDLCERCLARFFCETEEGKAIKGCAEVRARWLLQEYVEPDSWEKIEADAKKGTIGYWDCLADCDRCDIKPYERYGIEGCGVAKACDLVARCKKLAGVE